MAERLSSLGWKAFGFVRNLWFRRIPVSVLYLLKHLLKGGTIVITKIHKKGDHPDR